MPTRVMRASTPMKVDQMEIKGEGGWECCWSEWCCAEKLSVSITDLVAGATEVEQWDFACECDKLNARHCEAMRAQQNSFLIYPTFSCFYYL